MKNPTLTFADVLLPNHPERKCLVNFIPFSFWRNITDEERKTDELKNTIAICETVLKPHLWMYLKEYSVKEGGEWSIPVKFCIKCNQKRIYTPEERV